MKAAHVGKKASPAQLAANFRRGKTYEEIYGPDRGAEMRAQQAERARHRSYTHTPESKAKISAGLQGVVFSVERNRKISAAQKGTKHSDERRWKNSESQKGKKLSLAHRAKIGASQRGKVISQECRRKIIESNARHWATHPTSSLETITRAILDALYIEYVPSKVLVGLIVDIFVPSRNLVIECDGTYWHSRPGAPEKDAERDRRLLAAGYVVLRLPEPEIKSGAAVEHLKQVFGVA